MMDQCLPIEIVAWWGPAFDQITLENMRRLRECGFTVSLGMVSPDRLVESLDIAAACDVKLIVGLDDVWTWEFPKKPNQFTPGWRDRIRANVELIRTHPGLYGYYLVDEPPYTDLADDVMDGWRILRECDGEHLCYINHWAVNQTWAGAKSYDDLWVRWSGDTGPELITTDLYPCFKVEDQDVERYMGTPYFFDKRQSGLREQYFEMLDLQRSYSWRWGVPMWGCALATHAISSETADGEIRFQVMCLLAYGAVGVQYFAYVNLFDQSLTAAKREFEIVKRINALITAWGGVLTNAQHIGVYHHPANMYYTRPLDQFVLGSSNDLYARGGAVVVAQWLEDDGCELLLIINRDPYDPSETTFHFGTDTEIQECAESGRWRVVPAVTPRKQLLKFAAGEGRLFRIRRDIGKSQFAMDCREKSV
jgi:hypothetical protein